MNVPGLLIEIICLLSSFAIYIQKPVTPYLKLFPAFMGVTVLIELTGWQLGAHGLPPVRMYNYFTSFEFEFYLFLVREIIRRRIFKTIIFGVMALFAGAALYNINFVQVDTFATFSYAIGCLLIVAASIYYFLELFQFPKAVNLLNEPAFWICSSILFFYCCTFPLMGLFNYLNRVTPVIMQHLNFILTFLNILLYSLFTIAFLCKLNIRKLIFSKADLPRSI